MAGLRSTKPSADRQPVNVKGAKRNHPRLRLAPPARPSANYEIVHGALVLPDPDQPGRLAHYFPGEVVVLEGVDAEPLLTRGIVVALGDEPVLYHTMPDRSRSYYDDYKLVNGERVRNPNPQREGNAKLNQIDMEQASSMMYGADSSSDALGVLNGSGR